MNRHNQLLLVDDDPLLNRFMVRSLAAQGFECQAVEDGFAALKLTEQQKFDFIITDLCMPCMDGLRLVEELMMRACDSIILVLTGNGDVPQAVEAIKLGAYEFLAKPIDIDRLVDILNRAQEYRTSHNEKHHLRQLARKWEVTFDASPDMIALLDTDRRIIRCNAAMSRTFDRKKDELIGMDCRQLLPGIAHSPGFPVQADNNCGTEIHTEEIHDDNLARDLQITQAPLRHEEGRLWGTVLFAHDVTEYKLIQKQLLHSQKMESVGTLAAGVAHEINNPVGFIHSNLSSLLRYMAKIKDFTGQCFPLLETACLLNPEELRQETERLKGLRKSLKLDYLLGDLDELVNESQEGTERIRKIVNSLRGFARNDDTQMLPTDLNERLDGVLDLTWNELKYKAKIIKEYGELPRISCCSTSLDQVFVNLLINAAHAIPDKGEIRIRTWAEDKMVCVSIADTGTGIPEHVISHIFEPFFTTKPVGKGTGLGLSISYDIVTKHGGELKVASKVGEGTTFTVMVPALRGAAQ